MVAPEESSRRRASIRLGVAAQVVMASILLLAVNYAGFHYYFRGDWSPAQKYALSDQTRDVLEQLPNSATVYLFFSPTATAPGFEVYGDVLNLLKEDQFAAGDKLTVELIDPMRNLSRARELQSEFGFGAEENIVIIEMEGRSKQIRAVDMAEYDLLPQLSGEPPRVVAFEGEQELTSALIELNEPRERILYFLQGQGEPSLGEGSTLSLLIQYISQQGVRVVPLNLSLKGAVPSDAGGVILMGARYDLPPATAKALKDYWESDGRLMILLNPEPEMTRLRSLIASAGIIPRDDRVLRTVQLGFVTGILRDVSAQFSPSNRVTRRFVGAEAMLPGGTCSLALNPVPGTSVEPMIMVEEEFWGETEYVTDENKGVVFEEAKDTAAPLILAAMAERGGVADEQIEVSSARMVVVGNSEFVADGVITEPNLDFVLGSLNWMLDRTYLTGVTPKNVRAFNLNLTDVETGRIAFYVLVVIPGTIAFLGIIVCWRKRR